MKLRGYVSTRAHRGVRNLSVCSCWLLAVSALAQVGGQSTGLQATGALCRNLTTGQQVSSASGSPVWDCEALGLGVSVGDRVQIGLRGGVPLPEAGLNVQTATLPEDFAPQLVSKEPGGSQILPGDIDLDGDLDIVASDGPFRWLENSGDDPPSFVVEHALDHLIPNDDALHSLELIDVDEDGLLDILGKHILGPDFDRFSWFRNNGGSPPTFSRREVLAEQFWDVTSVATADVDGDGDLDFLATRSGGGCAQCVGAELLWVETVGSDYVQHLIAVVSGSVLAADLDQDGDPDALVADLAFDQVTWFENVGGTFTEQHLVASGFDAESMSVADLDGDGDLDVVVVYDTGDNDDISNWYRNLGDGSLVEHLLYQFPTDTATRGIIVADFSGDGLPDIVLKDDDPVWMENLGGSPSTFTAHSGPLNCVIATIGSEAGDIDQDGRLDLVGDSFLETQWCKNQIGRRLTVTGVGVREYSCRNRTTGQSVRVQTTETAVDCEHEGLTVNPGDEIEIFARGKAE